MKKIFLAHDVKEENHKKIEDLYNKIKNEYKEVVIINVQEPRKLYDIEVILDIYCEALKNDVDVLIVAIDTDNNGVIKVNRMLEQLIKKARQLKIEIRYYSLMNDSITIEKEESVKFKMNGEEDEENIIKTDTVDGPLEFNMNEKDYKMITICGSTKQKDQILELKALLEAKGYSVLTPEFNVKTMSESIAFTIHKAKIDVSEAVYFLLKPKDGLGHSAGNGMQREIRYCIQQEKEIVFVSPDEIRI